MTIDGYVRWLRRATLAVALIMIGWGSSVVLGQPVTGWFAASATIWMALLLISALWQLDRKSTRLNSSHSQISYAVFCLKKKKKRQTSPCLAARGAEAVLR